MKLAIMQPYLFPYIGYFQLMAAAERFVVYDDVSYIKQGWINRNRIMVNGQPHMFTLPLRNAGSNVGIRDIEIGGSDYLKWQNKFIRTLEQAYKKAPFQNEVIELVKGVFDPDRRSLAEVLLAAIEAVRKRLEIDVEIVPTSSRYGNDHLSGADRVIDICKKEGASVYINPIGGKELYDAGRFSSEGITLQFLRARPMNFVEFKDTQLQSLSILDVMMWNGSDWIREQLQEFDLVNRS